MPAKVKEPVEVGEQVTKPREKYAQLRGRLPDDINKIANESKELYEFVFKLPTVIYDESIELSDFISDLSKQLDPNLFKIKSINPLLNPVEC